MQLLEGIIALLVRKVNVTHKNSQNLVLITFILKDFFLFLSSLHCASQHNTLWHRDDYGKMRQQWLH